MSRFFAFYKLYYKTSKAYNKPYGHLQADKIVLDYIAFDNKRINFTVILLYTPIHKF